MLSKQQKNRGIVFTLTSIIEGFLVILVVALLLWFSLSRIMEIHVSVEENLNERHSIILANALISNENIVYIKDGKILRGVLDAEKLDKLFIKKSDFLSNIKLLTSDVDLGISYPNSIIIVLVLDLEKCNNNDCDGWIVRLRSPLSLSGISLFNFMDCLNSNIKVDVGTIFRFFLAPPLGGLWQPWDIDKCVKNNIPPSFKSFFNKNRISSQGFPILIKYKDSIHVGRIFVGLGEFI